MNTQQNICEMQSNIAVVGQANTQQQKMAVGEYYYQSISVKIGKSEWRLTVRESQYYGPVTEYQFRPVGSTVAWRNERQWPGFDGNLSDSGMPSSLADKLYWPNVNAVKRALAGEVIDLNDASCTQGTLPLF